MRLPKPGTVTLNDILITQELSQRSSRSPNWQAENQAMRTLARQLANAPASMLQNLVDTALNLCQAGTAGISVLETTPDGEEVFRAHALAGMAQHVGSTAKRNSIPCGVCLDGLELSKADCSPFQLFSYPDRYFTYLQSVNTPIVEALVLPLIADRHALGTIWILSHDEQRHFDLEDVRLMTLLADFAAAALLLNRQQTQIQRHPTLEALPESEAQLAAELAAMKQLYDLNERLLNAEELNTILQEILTVAIAFTGMDRGNIQLLSADEKNLEITVHQGHGQAFVEYFRFGGCEAACGAALHFKERVILEDVTTVPLLQGTTDLEVILEDGIRSLQSTPLSTRQGRIVGILTTHSAQLHRPSKEQLQRLDLLVWMAADFIERVRAEADLRESEGKYRTLFNTMDEGFCILQLIFDEEQKPIDYLYIEINPVFEKQTGMKNALGKTIRKLVPDIEPFWIDIYGKVALTGEPTHFEDHSVSMGRWFDVNAFRIGEPHERKVALLFNDITVRKQAEEAIRAFFSNVSHEFRTPLTLLLSSIQETLSERAHPLTPTQQSQLQLAHRNAIRLLKLVNTLLDFSRIETGRIQAVYEPTDLATLTIELASSFESAIEQAGLRLVIDCPPLRSPVYVERSMWEKIVLNLLSNAFKFTFAGEIAVRLTLAGNSVELTVQDTGIGIAAAELPRLFERFYQVKGVKGRSFEGSGIGLSLVQELVLLHGGTIQVSSVEGEGSCFKVSIPTGFAHLPPEQIGSFQTLPSTATGVTAYVEEALGWLPEEAGEQGSHPRAEVPSVEGSGVSRGAEERTHTEVSPLPLRSSAPLPSSSAPLLRTARILLVDDNADMRSYLKRILSERWQVETAANGAIALSLIQQQPPDLVLTDVMMPELDGLQLLQALRADPQTKSIPIILLSARAGEEATIEGLEALADDYLIKPFSARELLTRIETHLELARLRFERSTNRFKNEFLLTVTHELQSPLASILGWARLLQSKPFDPDKTAWALATIERNATIEAKLIKDLLDVSAILSGKLRLKSQVVDLVALVQNVTTTFREAAEAKRIQLIKTIPDEVPSNVFADGDRLKQVIANLLENAIKFTPLGGQVNISLERIDSGIQITVSDTGIGIRPDFLPYVFDRFTQAEVPSRHTPGGVGIGLAIARHLVELHHGTLKVASVGEGRGATFTIRLPLMSAVGLNSDAPAQEA